MRQRIKRLRILSLSILLLGSLALLLLPSLNQRLRPKPTPSAWQTDKHFSPSEFRIPEEEVGCKDLVSRYCTKLYSSQGRGNLKLTDGKNKFWTLQGETTNNIDTAWFAFYRSVLKNRTQLPADLRRALTKRQFFEKIAKVLERPSKKEMKFDQNIRHFEQEDLAYRAWNFAVDETIARRLEEKFPGTHALSSEELPQEAELEKWRIRAKLWSQISIALWSRHPAWLSVQKSFERLKESFRVAIKDNVRDKAIRETWLEKLDRVKLTLPGQNPVTAHRECILSTRNAYYYPYLNTLTVCAGYFNGGEQIQTLAHELAHAFDSGSRIVDFHLSSRMSKDLRQLRNRVCERKSFDCGDWKAFQARYAENVAELKSYQPEMYEFHQCLQKEVPEKALGDEDILAKAKKATRERFSEMTKDSAFFRITSPDLPLPSGETIENPNFLNPCAYEVWNQDRFAFDSDFVSLLFFTAEFRCEAQEATAPVRTAVEKSRQMTEDLMSAVIKNEGIFSGRDELQSEGFSSPPSERFADRLGSYAVAEYLRRYPSIGERRGRYLVSSFWLCEKPSLRLTNYQQFQALADLIVDRGVHAESELRMKDWLSAPVREQLSCQMDFEHKECNL